MKLVAGKLAYLSADLYNPAAYEWAWLNCYDLNIERHTDIDLCASILCALLRSIVPKKRILPHFFQYFLLIQPVFQFFIAFKKNATTAYTPLFQEKCLKRYFV